MFDWRKALKDMTLTVVPALTIALVVSVAALFALAEILVWMGFRPTTFGLSLGGSLLMMVLVVGLMAIIDRRRGLR